MMLAITEMQINTTMKYHFPSTRIVTIIILKGGFPGGSGAKNLPANAEDIVRSLIWEDPTCHRATKPVQRHRACALELRRCRSQGPRTPGPRSPTEEAATVEAQTPQLESSPRSPQLEKVSTTAKTQHGQKQINKNIFKKKILSVGEDMEMLELSYTGDGNVKWSRHCGRQFGSCSKN